jgi:hypothetical protein
MLAGMSPYVASCLANIQSELGYHVKYLDNEPSEGRMEAFSGCTNSERQMGFQ